MPPKTPRTPAKAGKKAEKTQEDDVDALKYLREREDDKILRLKATITGLNENEHTATAARVYMRKLEAINEKFTTVHERIIQQVEAKDRNQHNDCALEFEANYDELTMTLERWIQNEAAAVPTVSTILAPFVQTPVIIQQPLPCIIPTFDGKYEHWEKFRIMFRDVVDQSNEPPRIKLYHLEKALIGDAAGLLDAIADGNYEHAWKLLQERFEDKRRMVDLHIGGLLMVKKLSCESHSALRALLEDVVGHVENLRFLSQEFSGVSELIVVYLLTHALDDETRKLWESSVPRGEQPKYQETIQFLKDQVAVLERCQSTSKEAEPKSRQRVDSKSSAEQPTYLNVNVATTASGPKLRCDLCDGSHLTFQCAAFAGLTVCQRMEKVRRKNVCINCLRLLHYVKKCKSMKCCKECRGRHHTLLHKDQSMPTNRSRSQPTQVSQPQPPSTATVSDRSQAIKPAMILTAVVSLGDDRNRPVPCRILMDSGSQVNFVTESMTNRLNLKKQTANTPIRGIGTSTTRTKEAVVAKLQSRYNNFTADVECLIVPKITDRIPSSSVNISDWSTPNDLELADPLFNMPSHIDMLVGVSIFFRLLKRERITLSGGLPELIETHLGWIVAGEIDRSVTPTVVVHTDCGHQRSKGNRNVISQHTSKAESSQQLHGSQAITSHFR